MKDLELAGKQLESVVVNYTVRIQLDAYFIVIESPFTVVIGGDTVSSSPEEDAPDAFEPVHQLVGQTVEAAVADDAGSLHVSFSGGGGIVVEPDAAYEAWSVSGPDGALVVSTPGGKFAYGARRIQRAALTRDSPGRRDPAS